MKNIEVNSSFKTMINSQMNRLKDTMVIYVSFRTPRACIVLMISTMKEKKRLSKMLYDFLGNLIQDATFLRWHISE